MTASFGSFFSLSSSVSRANLTSLDIYRYKGGFLQAYSSSSSQTTVSTPSDLSSLPALDLVQLLVFKTFMYSEFMIILMSVLEVDPSSFASSSICSLGSGFKTFMVYLSTSLDSPIHGVPNL